MPKHPPDSFYVRNESLTSYFIPLTSYFTNFLPSRMTIPLAFFTC